MAKTREPEPEPEIEDARWNPMDTAPTDGSHVLLYRPHIQFVGYYSRISRSWYHNAPGLPAINPPPMAWRLLPPEPNTPPPRERE